MLNVGPIRCIKCFVHCKSELVRLYSNAARVLLGAQIEAVLSVAVRLLLDDQHGGDGPLVLEGPQDRGAIPACLNAVESAFASVLDVAPSVLRRIGKSECLIFLVNIKVKLTKVFLVAWVTCERLLDNLSLELHLLEAGASGPILGALVSQTTLAIKAIFLKVVLCRICFAGRGPTELSSVILTVHIHASFETLLTILNVGVPAKLMVLTLVIIVAKFKLRLQFGASGLKRPVCRLPAEEANVAV